MLNEYNTYNNDNQATQDINKDNELKEKHNNKTTIENLETQIKTDHFKSKEELFEKLVELRNNGMMEIIDNRKMRELLDLYDKSHQKSESPMDTQNFSSVSVENKNLIVSKQNDRVLQTEKDSSTFEEEFKQEQNEMSIQSESGLVNADKAFENMANKKIEMSLISLEEAILSSAISVENLNKIRFFITSGYVNPHAIRVDITKGILYNIETSDVYEIRYNPDTQEYEIYKNNQLDYSQSGLKEEQEKQQERNKPKVRILKKEDNLHLNNAAFTKVSFLVLNIISIILLITMAILLKK